MSCFECKSNEKLFCPQKLKGNNEITYTSNTCNCKENPKYYITVTIRKSWDWRLKVNVASLTFKAEVTLVHGTTKKASDFEIFNKGYIQKTLNNGKLYNDK